MTRLLVIFKNPMAVIFVVAAFGLLLGTYFTAIYSNKTQFFNQNVSQDYQSVLQNLKPDAPAPLPIKFQQNLTQNLATKLATLITGGAKENLGNIPPERGIRHVSPDQIEKTFNDFLKTSKPIVLPVIADKELKITNLNTRQAVNNYLADVAIIFNRYLDDKFDQTSDEVLADALKTGDFSKALSYAQIYNHLFEDLKTVWVPSTWLAVHKQWLQIFGLKAQILEAASQVDNDTLRATIALQTYQSLFDFEDRLSAQINGLMKRQGIK